MHKTNDATQFVATKFRFYFIQRSNSGWFHRNIPTNLLVHASTTIRQNIHSQVSRKGEKERSRASICGKSERRELCLFKAIRINTNSMENRAHPKWIGIKSIAQAPAFVRTYSRELSARIHISLLIGTNCSDTSALPFANSRNCHIAAEQRVLWCVLSIEVFCLRMQSPFKRHLQMFVSTLKLAIHCLVLIICEFQLNFRRLRPIDLYV